jgi:hypothetical protein
VCLAGFNFCFVLFAGAYATQTRVGKVAVLGQEAVLWLIDEHVQPGEDVLIYPYAPTYYFLSSTTNPTRYSFLMYNYNTPAQFREAMESLDQRRVKYVLWDTTFAARAMDNFSKSLTINHESLILEPYLESHYKLLEDDQGIRIMERK